MSARRTGATDVSIYDSRVDSRAMAECLVWNIELGSDARVRSGRCLCGITPICVCSSRVIWL